MHPLFLYGYVTASVGVVVSAIYVGLTSFNRQRNLRLILENTIFQQIYERRRHHPVAHQYANRYRTKLITRRLLNKINQLNPRIHLLSVVPRWSLIYTTGGELLAIPHG